MKKYRVRLHSKPGIWEFYEGFVDVYADDDADAEEAARRKLSTTTFKERGLDAWVIDSVERVIRRG